MFSLLLLVAAAAVEPAAPGGLPVETDGDRIAELSEEVEPFLKKQLCGALKQDGRLVAPLLAAPVLASPLEGAARTALGGAYPGERLTFAVPVSQEPVAVAAALERYLAELAIRTRCGIGFHHFVVARRPSMVAEAAFNLTLAGVGADGTQLLDTGEVRVELTRLKGRPGASWRITRLELTPRRRVRAANVRFTEVTVQAGLPLDFPERWVNLSLGTEAFTSEDIDRGGLAVADADGDGRPDILVVADGPNLFFRNRGDGTFEECAAKVGLSDPGNGRGAVFADLDGDGDLDLVLANRPTQAKAGELRLYRNDGGKFTLAATPGGKQRRELTHVAVADVDGDGDLDVHVSAYGKFAGAFPRDLLDDDDGAPDLLLLNQGGFRFVDRAKEWGVADRRFTLAAALADLDGDGRPELIAADDFGRKRLYKNEGNRFTDISEAAGPGKERANGMGLDVADFDGDGELDLYFSNMHSNAGQRLASGLAGWPRMRERIHRASQGNTLWLGKGGLSFEEGGVEAGIADGGWAYGVQLFDATNEGRLSAFSPCGFLTRPDEAEL